MSQSLQDNGVRWKVGLALLVLVFLIGTAVSLVTAAHRVSRVVDTDYYSHGLHYGQTQDGSRNAGAGWTISAATLGPTLQVEVTDRLGAPVGGGRLSFEPQAEARQSGALELAETSPGVFRAARPARSSGELRGTLRFTRGDAAATRKLVLLN